MNAYTTPPTSPPTLLEEAALRAFGSLVTQYGNKRDPEESAPLVARAAWIHAREWMAERGRQTFLPRLVPPPVAPLPPIGDMHTEAALVSDRGDLLPELPTRAALFGFVLLVEQMRAAQRSQCFEAGVPPTSTESSVDVSLALFLEHIPAPVGAEVLDAIEVLDGAEGGGS